MSYAITLYFRDPQTQVFVNPYEDAGEIIYTPEEKKQIQDRDAHISQAILEEYPDYFDLISDEHGVHLDVKEEYWKWSFSFEYYDTFFVIDIRYHDIPEAEESVRNAMITHIIWIVSQRYECIIDDPQIGTIYIPERLLEEVREQFVDIDTIVYTQEKDITLSEESFDQVSKMFAQSSIPEGITHYDREWANSVNELVGDEFLAHTSQGLINLVALINKMHTEYRDSSDTTQDTQEDLEANTRLAGSFFGTHLLTQISGATWVYGMQEMEGSTIQVRRGDACILTIAPFEMVRSGIIHGDFFEQITQIQKKLEKAEEKLIPLWERRSIRLGISVGLFVFWLGALGWKAQDISNPPYSASSKQSAWQRSVTTYSPVTITVDPVTYEISRPKDMKDYSSLTWVIEDRVTHEHLLKRNALNETTYTYYRNYPGSAYRVYLEAFDGEKYVTVSNVVEYSVPVISIP